MTRQMLPHGCPPNQSEGPIDVLVVDDDPLWRRYLAHRLQLVGFAVRTSVDGPGLRSALHHLVPNVVVLSLVVRNESGLELCRELRSVPATADLAIIVTSATNSSAVSARVDEVRALAAGATQFLPKTRSIEPLVRAIEEATNTMGVSPPGALW